MKENEIEVVLFEKDRIMVQGEPHTKLLITTPGFSTQQITLDVQGRGKIRCSVVVEEDHEY